MWFLLILLIQPPVVIGPGYLFSWDQYAVNEPEVKALKFNYYLDNDGRINLEGVKCEGTAPNFVCTAPVMKVSPGTHTITLEAVNTHGQSGQSAPFRFRVIYNRNAPY